MPVADFLDRFRRFRAGPGAPARVIGVPATGDALAAELAPLFASLDEFDAEEQIRVAVAQNRAEDVRTEAAREAAEIRKRARVEADRERELAAATRLRAVEAEIKQVLSGAEGEAARVREVGAERLPALVDDVLTCLREGQT